MQVFRARLRESTLTQLARYYLPPGMRKLADTVGGLQLYRGEAWLRKPVGQAFWLAVINNYCIVATIRTDHNSLLSAT
ncbi:MAG: hypothetical protein HNEKOMLI_00314 [Sodalis sp. Psp]|nr:hypothetical protein [Sodalis sp. Psp]